jgi:hypothetical protein
VCGGGGSNQYKTKIFFLIFLLGVVGVVGLTRAKPGGFTSNIYSKWDL